MTRIVQILTTIDSSGRAALRLQNEFIRVGHESTIVSLQYGISILNNVKYLGIRNRSVSWIDAKIQNKLLKDKKKEFGLFSYPVLGSDISKLQEVEQADIIYLHWVLGGFLNFNSLTRLAELGKPVIIIMHDMWSITGGCHYSFTCDNYKTGCGHCQMFPGNSREDKSSNGVRKKMRLYSAFSNLYFVSSSKWLLECASEALLTKNKPLFYIPNVIDNTVFKPFDKMIARKILNIEGNQPIIAFGAYSINSPYKGWPYLLKALEHLKTDNGFDDIQVLIFGSGYNKQIDDSIPFKTKFLGYLADEFSTVIAYNAADVFIAPSIADNQPATVQESLCCGTPVVGFDIGGIPDMISHMKNGYLAKYKDAEDISKGIRYCLQSKIKGYMLPAFETSVTLNRHYELFKFINRESPGFINANS